MPRVLAVDWDSSEVRCVVGSCVGRKLRVHEAASSPLAEVEQASQPPVADVAGGLRALLGDLKLGRAAMVVGVDRASVELFHFTLPPATDAELALLVLNQAVRESPQVVETGVLDFVALSDDPAQARAATAAVLSRERCRAIEEACAAAGCKPGRIVLRTLASVSYFLKTASPPERSCLLVNVLAEEVDLAVLVDGRTALWRTVRIPRDAGEREVAARLVPEMNRTLLVAQQGPLGIPVERVYVFGGPGEHQALTDQWAAESNTPLTVLDPFEGADVSAIEVPGNAGRFASLLGMVLDEAHGTHAIDFLHPKRPPRGPNRRRIALVAAALLGLLALAGAYAYWDAYSTLAERNRHLAAQRKDLDETLKRGRQRTQLFEAVSAWRAGEVVWLDELRELSLRLPPSRDLLVQRMTISAGRGGGGVIELQGVVRDASIVEKIDRDLRDDFHAVSPRRTGDYPQGNPYAWLFERTIAVAARDRARYRTPPLAGP